MMETQIALVEPNDDGGLNVHAATQWIDHVQMAIAFALKIPQNK